MSATSGDHAAVVNDAAGEASLRELAALAKTLGSERVFEETSALAERIGEGRFYVACVGQFKRGKSTLLNALMGNRILPAGVVPVTAVPTVVRYGKIENARVRFEGGTWREIAPDELTQYVSEDYNPENSKKVSGMEVFSPSALLAEGMCFVDTPGLGSIFAGNTAATQAFVPHIDAAIVVVGADPPIAGEELDLVEELAKHVRDLVIVLNKADRTSEAEREIAKSFTSRVLQKRLNRPVGPIYEISAEEQLQNGGAARDWPQFVDVLKSLVRESGRSLTSSAGARGLQRLSEQLLTITAAEKVALLRPIEDSERRIQILRQTISQAERSLNDLGYLFTAEQHRLSDMFLDQRKTFLAAAFPQAVAEFDEQSRKLPRSYGPKFRRDAMLTAQTIAERHLLPWLETEQTRAEEAYRAVAARFVSIGNDFLKKLAESGIPELARTPDALDAEKGFRTRSRFTFEHLFRISLPASPLRYLADVFLGIAGASSVIEREARDFLHQLMDTNSSRVQSDVVNRVQESREQLEVEIRKLLHEVSRISESALAHAREARAQGMPAVEAAVARLDSLEAEIRALQAAQP